MASLASLESLSTPMIQEIVVSADIRCIECQKKVADFMFKMNEMESVVVNVMEKNVTLSCKYPNVVNVSSSSPQVAAKSTNPLSKVAMVKWIFRSLHR